MIYPHPHSIDQNFDFFSLGIWLLADFDFVLSNIGTIVQRLRTIKNIKFDLLSTFY